MKKLILLFILLQISLFANKYIGIEYESSTAKLEREIKMSLNSYSIVYNAISSQHIIKAFASITPSQLPASRGGIVAKSFTMKGYGAGMSFAYKAYNKNEIFIAPEVSLGYKSITAITDMHDGTDETEVTSIPLYVSMIIGIDYKKDSFAFIDYALFKTDLDKSDSSESTSALKLGVSHSIADNFSVQSLYYTNLDNEAGVKSSKKFSIGVGYSF